MSVVYRADVPGHAVNCGCSECRAVEATRAKILANLVAAARRVADNFDHETVGLSPIERGLHEALVAYDAWGDR